MTYTLEQFCEDCRTALGADGGDGGREIVRANLGRLLANEDFVAAHAGRMPNAAFIGFTKIPISVSWYWPISTKRGVESPPHDHGPSWAIYGTGVGHNDMTEWRETGKTPGGSEPIVEPAERYRLDPAWSAFSTRATSTRSGFPTARASCG